MEIVTEQNCFRIKFDFSNRKKNFQYENSRRFMFGALLCFSSDNFKTVLFGKVVDRDTKYLEKAELIIGFSEDINLPENLYGMDFVMVESTVYFEPYYQVLNVLKTMQFNNFPMERYIINVETTTSPPEYLLGIDPEFYSIEDDRFWPLNWGERRFYGLNDSQSEAFQAALTREFAIIQGPPGTGKTFLGLKIAHTLLNNKDVWYKNTPMLVICFTNHALDQFLEGLLPVTHEVLRVGGQSKNQNLNNFNIRNKRRRMNGNPAVSQKRHEVQNCIREISSINQYLSEIDEKTSVVEFSVFRDVIPNYRGSWFDSAENDDILAWLFSGGEVIHRENRREWQPRELIVDPNNQDNNHGVEGVMADIENDQILDEVFDDIVVHCSNYLITLKSLSDKLNMLAKDLTLLASNDTMNYWEKAHHEDKLNFELYRTESEMDYLRMRLNQFENNIGPPQMVNLMKPQYMSPDDRWQLYFHWLGMFVAMLRQRKETISREFRRIYTVYSEMRDMEDAQIMKGCLVVGMTTTGAARLQASLKTLKSPIVIVEEAAEVLEAHIISSLTSHCKHLILIGDHQQLKPSTANFKIETKFRLGISLFERMVINKIQCHTLNIQHRMRPEISGLIRPTIYPVLEDHESVLNRPQILGIENCVYFLDHKEQEQLCKDNSKKNIHEAKFLIQLARHLILNGYKPENITILAAYLGQMFEMQREKKVYSNLLQDVRIAVLDNYQGEESDIILLSLVRSNSDGKIGFLKTENRVCVALSRARNGFYIMGNLTQLCDNSEIWPKIRDTLKKQDAIGPYLTLRCQVHHHKITQAKKAEDFSTFPEGGCDLMCEAKLGCGHVCKRLCHIEDREHVIYKCREKCVNLLCDDPAHTCLKLCYEDCGACTYLVHRELQCGHSARIACHVDPATHKCMELIHTKLPCEHEAEKPCHMDPNAFRCPHPCDSRVEPCGHACKLSCHIRNDPDHLEYKCTKPCENYREGCTLQNDEAHICPKMCFEECPRCEVFVLKKRTRCNHAFKIPCYLDVDLIECQKSCSKLLPCGHKCLQKCEEPCGDCIKMVEKNVPDCNHKIQIECFKAPNRKYCKGKCPRKLPCGHICTKKCNEDCTTRCKVIVDCSIPSPCGHVMKKIKCFLKDTADPKILLEGCTEKCDFKLKCNHICGGTCGGCSQGRIHQRCTEKCGVPLVCNHECPIPCREACKPCMKPCEYRCKHSKCKRKCGDPCTFCKEPCGRKCKHQNCKKKCGEPCNVPPCDKPCEKKLKCGHPCVGFCGDRCPILCKNCNHEELTDVLLGNEDEENAIYVMLEDCMHTFESGDLERWLRMDENEIKAKVCPRCKTTIKTTSRYSNYIKRTMDDITKVKQKFYGYEKENERARHDIYKEISKLHSRFAMTAGSPHLTSAIDRLKLRLCERRGNRRQNANKMDLEAIKTKMQILDAIYKPFAQQKTEKIRIMHECTKQIAFIVTAVMRDEDSITGQEIEDIMLEIDKLTRYSQFYQINRLPSSSYNNADDVSSRLQESPIFWKPPGDTPRIQTKP
ncbi:hypothetical protein JTB14_025229 [Gonioctena quinquepunctata]|nr:hypothetical protein JTB14_025229 [Gonioctena quinquepunctata]